MAVGDDKHQLMSYILTIDYTATLFLNEFNCSKSGLQYYVADNTDLSSFVSPLLPPPKSAKSREITKKNRTYSGSTSSKVIDLGSNQKRVCDITTSLSLIVTLDVSRTVFEITHKARK